MAVEISIPGERWELELTVNGEMEVSNYKSFGLGDFDQAHFNISSDFLN